MLDDMPKGQSTSLVVDADDRFGAVTLPPGTELAAAKPKRAGNQVARTISARRGLLRPAPAPPYSKVRRPPGAGASLSAPSGGGGPEAP